MAEAKLSVTRDGRSVEACEGSLGAVSPLSHTQYLRPGESWDGDILIAFSHSEQGFVFAAPGHYCIRMSFPSADVQDSNEVQIVVSGDVAPNHGFLNDLGELAQTYFQFRSHAPAGDHRALRSACIQMLTRIIGRDKPILLAPPGAEDPERRLVEGLELLLARYPHCDYTAYVARYLGLVYLKDFERTGGMVANYGSRLTGEPSYAKARQLLVTASERPLWPRGAALYNLGILYAMAQQWEQVEVVAQSLQSRGQSLAKRSDELLATMHTYRNKLDRRREKGLPVEGGSGER